MSDDQYTERERKMDAMIAALTREEQSVRDEIIATALGIVRLGGRWMRAGLFRRRRDLIELMKGEKAPAVVALIEQLLEFSDNERNQIITAVMIGRELRELPSPLIPIGDGHYVQADDPAVRRKFEAMTFNELREVGRAAVSRLKDLSRHRKLP
jgi:hypothetical protein